MENQGNLALKIRQTNFVRNFLTTLFWRILTILAKTFFPSLPMKEFEWTGKNSLLITAPWITAPWTNVKYKICSKLNQRSWFKKILGRIHSFRQRLRQLNLPILTFSSHESTTTQASSLRCQKLLWHPVGVVNDYTDTVIHIVDYANTQISCKSSHITHLRKSKDKAKVDEQKILDLQ